MKYPGDDAPKAALARWMAAEALEADLPPELPVMAALVESGLIPATGASGSPTSSGRRSTCAVATSCAWMRRAG